MTAKVDGVELQQAIGFLGKAFLDRMHNLVMLRYREPDLARMLEFWPIGRNAIADAKRQFDEAMIPACGINSLVEGVVGVLVACARCAVQRICGNTPARRELRRAT